jgi:hypothetical protein
MRGLVYTERLEAQLCQALPTWSDVQVFSLGQWWDWQDKGLYEHVCPGAAKMCHAQKVLHAFFQ